MDDLIGTFRDDQNTVKYIQEMQEKIGHKYNHLVSRAERFYEVNKDLERKDYAIKAKSSVPDIMGLVMNKYLGKYVDYKEFFMRTKMYQEFEE